MSSPGSQCPVPRTWQAYFRCSVNHLSIVAYGLSPFPMIFPLGVSSSGHLSHLSSVQ